MYSAGDGIRYTAAFVMASRGCSRDTPLKREVGMGAREAFRLRGLPLGVLALALAWIAPAHAAAGTVGIAAESLLTVLLLVLIALLLHAWLRAGPWALVDLAIPGILFGGAGAMLLEDGHRRLAAAYLGVAAVGVTAFVVGVIRARLVDRRRRFEDGRLEARRELRRIHRRLWLGHPEVDDDSIRAAVDDLADYLDGPAGHRAAVLLGVIAPICRARAHLAGELTRRPLALLREAGVEGSGLKAWLERELTAGTHLETDERGREWLEREWLEGEWWKEGAVG